MLQIFYLPYGAGLMEVLLGSGAGQCGSITGLLPFPSRPVRVDQDLFTE